MKTHFINVFFYLRGEEEKNQTIYCRINRNREKFRFSLKIKIDSLEWDEQSQRIKSRFLSASRINQRLTEIENKLLDEYHILSRNSNNVDLEVLRYSIFPRPIPKEIIPKEDSDNPLVKDLIDKFWKEVEEKFQARVIEKSTHKNSKMILNKFKEFIKMYYVSNSLRLRDVDIQFFPNFEHYLLTKTNLSDNYINKILKHSKRVFHHSYEMGWVNFKPRISFKTKYKNPKREILTREEIDRIEALNNLPKHLEEARDCAIVQLYTGLAYSDLRALNKAHLKTFLGRNWIIIERQKTGVQSKIVILDKVQKIIEKYMKPNRGNILPVKSNKQYNGYLKEIQGLCGIQTIISSHILRHTFATVIALSSGMSIETLSKVLGHTQIKTTAIYAKVLDKKVMEEFERINF